MGGGIQEPGGVEVRWAHGGLGVTGPLFRVRGLETGRGWEIRSQEAGGAVDKQRTGRAQGRGL